MGLLIAVSAPVGLDLHDIIIIGIGLQRKNIGLNLT